MNSLHASIEPDPPVDNYSVDNFDDGHTRAETAWSPAVAEKRIAELLEHFGVHHSDSTLQQKLAEVLNRCANGKSVHDNLVSELRRHILPVAGAQLDNAFVEMAPDVVEEAEVEAVSLKVSGRQLQGVRYQGQIFRLLEAFDNCHRLQAFCLGQTLREKAISYLMTRSAARFAVWVNVRDLPKRHHTGFES